MTYEQKKEIADKWLAENGWPSWDCLADTNSLHDYCETEMDIIEAAEERALADMME